jgi:hypothetical protein
VFSKQLYSRSQGDAFPIYVGNYFLQNSPKDCKQTDRSSEVARKNLSKDKKEVG